MRWLWLLCLVLVVTPAYAQQGNPPPPPLPEDSDLSAQVMEWVRSTPVDAEASHFGAIGAMHFLYMGNPALEFIRANGVAAFYADQTRVDEALRSIQRQMDTRLTSLAGGGMFYLRDVQTFPWGMIEPEQGVYNFSISDAMVAATAGAGLHLVGTAMPFASWDQAGQTPSSDEMCLRLMSEDHFYLAHDGVMGQLQNMEAYAAWLAATVERYDGDGVDDAANIGEGVRYWQVYNEPEGDRCGGYRNDVAGFVELMRVSYEAIKGACAECLVLNGGAGIALWREGENLGGVNFWSDYAAMGGAQYVDVIAAHYNNGKVDGGVESDFATQIQRLRGHLGEDKPVWVTEFGALVDFERPAGVDAPANNFNIMSETEGAAWFMRFYTVGIANGVDRFFSDMTSFITPDARIRLPYYVNLLLEAKIGAMTEAAMLADGQYRFTVNGSAVYAVGRRACGTQRAGACDRHVPATGPRWMLRAVRAPRTHWIVEMP
ncbi:MAG: hypothetical protein U0694_06585 [Anaerolineae bacterium]